MPLTREQRRALPASAFAVPAKRALPLIDERHVRMAAAQYLQASGLTDEERAIAKARIAARAAELGVELKAAGQGAYIRRNLTPESAAEFQAWAVSQGFISLVPPPELHVTIVHSTAPVSLILDAEVLTIAGGDRSVAPIGPGGALALRFESDALQVRWAQAIAGGATWDFDGYLPHVTIAWGGEPVDLDAVQPFAGDLVFGPEIQEPLNANYVEEKGLRMEAMTGIRLEGAGLDAMALQMPEVSGHPNRMPFSGVLTRLDTPSDRAPSGSDGKKVILTKSAAERALASLIGMAVDFTPNFDGHDAVRKFGVITAATIEGDAIQVGGHIYARDFPKEASRVRTDKALLGMSWELADIYVESPTADPLVITDAYFTGAAILRKDKAAYQSTSLAASAEDHDMTKEEIAAAVAESLAAALAPFSASISTIAAAQEAQNKAIETLQASAAEAAKAAETAAKEAEGAELASLKTKVADLEAAAAKKVDEPTRKTLSPQISAILAKADLTLPGGADKLAIGAVDAALNKAGLSPVKRMEVKNELQRAGAL